MSAWRVDLRARVGALEIDVDLVGDQRPVALVGPNGSGKTSILRMIAGVARPLAVELVVGGRELASTSRGIDVPAEGRGIGYVPQGYGLFPHLSALHNVAFGRTIRGRRHDRGAGTRRALDTLRQLGCGHLADRRPAELSGGERQRVALARALAIEPGLLLLDEPLAALDAVVRREVRVFLSTHLRRLNCPTVVVTHEPRDVVALDAQVVLLEAGRVVQRGELADLRRAPSTAFAAAFAGALDHVAPPTPAGI